MSDNISEKPPSDLNDPGELSKLAAKGRSSCALKKDRDRARDRVNDEKSERLRASMNKYTVRCAMAWYGALALPVMMLIPFTAMFVLVPVLTSVFFESSMLSLSWMAIPAALPPLAWALVGLKMRQESVYLEALPFQVEGYFNQLAHRECTHQLDIIFEAGAPEESLLGDALGILKFPSAIKNYQTKSVTIHVNHIRLSNPPSTQNWLRRWFHTVIDRLLLPIHREYTITVVRLTMVE